MVRCNGIIIIIDDTCTYIGKTLRNLYSRAREHLKKSESKKQYHDSFIKKHQEAKHGSAPPNFEAKVMGKFCDCLTRQVSEGVAIRSSSKLHSIQKVSGTSLPSGGYIMKLSENRRNENVALCVAICEV